MTPPNADILIVFDGGAIGNPGKGYGSYAVRGMLNTSAPVRLDFPGTTTNNQAEYLTLIAALRSVIEGLGRRGRRSEDVRLAILTDSQLVVEQLNGRWKVRNADLRARVEEARELLRRFAAWSLDWQPRSESVRILGH